MLPAGIEPQSYKLKLFPDLERFTFKGEVEITVQVTQPTATIKLHAKELQIKDASVGSIALKGPVGTRSNGLI